MAEMEGLVNLLGVVTALVCAALLYRGYRRTGVRLLAWSALCFVMLSAENAILFYDLFVIPEIELPRLVVFRQAVAAVGIACLTYSLVWESE
jgi:hypothetical protein